MNKTCFILAMEEEINLDQFIKNDEVQLLGSHPFKVFQLKRNQDLYLVFSSIGMINAASATQFMIDKYFINQFVSLGSAGTTNSNSKPMMPFIINKSFYGDSDLTTFGYKINQMARQPEFFESNDELNKHLKKVCENINLNVSDGICCSINSFINKQNKNAFNNLLVQNPSCVEMELVGISQICNLNNTPWTSLKIISDSILEPTLSSEQFYSNLKLISDLITKIIINW